LSSKLRLNHPSGLFPSVFPTKILCAFLIPSMPTMSPVRHIRLELTILIKFGEEHELWSSLLCIFLQPVKYTPALHTDEHAILNRVSSARSPPATSGKCDMGYCIVTKLLYCSGCVGDRLLFSYLQQTCKCTWQVRSNYARRLAREYVFSEQWQENVVLLPHSNVWKLSYMFLQYTHYSIWLGKRSYVRNISSSKCSVGKTIMIRLLG
jgi:hypothetical protein